MPTPENLKFYNNSRGGSRIFLRRGGALIIMVWVWLRNIAHKRGICTRGLGLRPSRFLLLSCYFGAFSLYLCHQRDISRGGSRGGGLWGL